jgi:hypothetical protein
MAKGSGSQRLSWLIALAILAVLGLVYWNASRRVGLRPSPSIAERRIGDPSLYPPRNIPGAVALAVTQTNIHETICISGYTRGVRPPSSVTNRIKRERFEEEKLPGTPSDYELDHLIPLELGGCPDCLTNLWMEPWSSPGAREKDAVENYLHREVCNDQMSLGEAQKLIAGDWFAVYKSLQSEKAP